MRPFLDAARDVPSYFVLALLGGIAGIALAAHQARRDGLEVRPVVVTSLAAIGGGLGGAKLWAALFEAWPILTAPTPWAALRVAGWSIVGGLIGGTLVGWLAARRAGLDPLRWVDAAAPGVALGRVGCLLAGCCFGRPTLFPVALVYDDYDAAARPLGVPLHAVPIFEAIACALLAWALTRVQPTWPGRRFAGLMVGYGSTRAALELLRSDFRGDSLAGLPPTTWGALAFIAIGVVVISHRRLAR